VTTAATNSVSEDQLNADEQAAMYDWLSELGSTGAIKAKLKRIKPKSTVFKGRVVNCGGTLDEYEEPVTEEQIRQEHGGGKFQLVVQHLGKNKNGNPQWKYHGARTFEIAGDPDVRRLILESGEDVGHDTAAPDGPVSQAMNMALRVAQDAQDRADRDGGGGMDHEAMRMMLDPLNTQIETLARSLAAKEQQVFELLNKPVDTTSQDRLFGIMESKEATHGNNLQAVRIAHESEMKELRSFHRSELGRREDRFERELDNSRKATDREIESLKAAHQVAIDSQRVGYDMRIDGLKDQKKQLERELNELKTELAALRGRKDMTPVQQMQGLVEIKNAMESIMPSAAEDTPKAGWERAIDAVMGSPLLEGVAQRIAEGPPGAEDSPAMGGMPQGQPGEQMVQVRRRDGQIVTVPASYVAQAQAAKAAREQATGMADAPPQQQEPELSIDPRDVEKAIMFIEASIRNGTPPEIFAASARNMMPTEILTYIKGKGVDHFLNNVAKLEEGSPLATVVGRTYVRKVAKFLLEGTTEGIDDPASPIET
jgi:uncharacterized protein (DUF2164 family)